MVSIVQISVVQETLFNPKIRFSAKGYQYIGRGCLEHFITDPRKHLRETGDLLVCPVCLTEKPLSLTKELELDEEVFYFCRCPHCMDAFNKNPEYYIRRLKGEEDYPGTFKAACCPD